MHALSLTLLQKIAICMNTLHAMHAELKMNKQGLAFNVMHSNQAEKLFPKATGKFDSPELCEPVHVTEHSTVNLSSAARGN